MNIAMQIKLNKISQIPAEIFKKLCKDHRFGPTFWDIFKYLLMRCAHFSMLLMRMKPINFIFSKSMYIVSEYQSTSRHQFEQYFNFVQQLTLPVVETRGFTKVLIISQENTVSIKKDRAVSIEAEFCRLFSCLIPRTTMYPASYLIFRACSIYAVLPNLRFHLMKTGRRSINKTSL